MTRDMPRPCRQIVLLAPLLLPGDLVGGSVSDTAQFAAEVLQMAVELEHDGSPTRSRSRRPATRPARGTASRSPRARARPAGSASASHRGSRRPDPSPRPRPRAVVTPGQYAMHPSSTLEVRDRRAELQGGVAGADAGSITVLAREVEGRARQAGRRASRRPTALSSRPRRVRWCLTPSLGARPADTEPGDVHEVAPRAGASGGRGHAPPSRGSSGAAGSSSGAPLGRADPACRRTGRAASTTARSAYTPRRTTHPRAVASRSDVRISPLAVAGRDCLTSGERVRPGKRREHASRGRMGARSVTLPAARQER